MSMSIILRSIKCNLTGKPFVDAVWLRKCGVVIGDDVDRINFQCSGNDATCLEIGSYCTLSFASVLTHYASLRRFIGNDCVMEGSVVTKDIPYSIVATGNPERVISSLDEFVAKHKHRMKEVPIRIYYNIQRNKMDEKQLTCFNNEIECKIVYAMKKLCG